MLILVTFSAESQGQVSMVIYEWQDVVYLGKQTSTDESFPVRYLIFNPPHDGSTLMTSWQAEDVYMYK